MKKRIYWDTPYEPSKPSEPSLKDEVYKKVNFDIEQFGTYREVSIDEIISIREKWLKQNDIDNKIDILFFCGVENDGGNGDDEYNLHVCVSYKLPLNKKEISEAKEYNKKKKDEYITKMNLYNHQMSDYLEIKKEKEKEKEDKEREQYLKLKEKFDK